MKRRISDYFPRQYPDKTQRICLFDRLPRVLLVRTLAFLTLCESISHKTNYWMSTDLEQVATLQLVCKSWNRISFWPISVLDLTEPKWGNRLLQGDDRTHWIEFFETCFEAQEWPASFMHAFCLKKLPNIMPYGIVTSTSRGRAMLPSYVPYPPTDEMGFLGELGKCCWETLHQMPNLRYLALSSMIEINMSAFTNLRTLQCATASLPLYLPDQLESLTLLLDVGDMAPTTEDVSVCPPSLKEFVLYCDDEDLEQSIGSYFEWNEGLECLELDSVLTPTFLTQTHLPYLQYLVIYCSKYCESLPQLAHFTTLAELHIITAVDHSLLDLLTLPAIFTLPTSLRRLHLLDCGYNLPWKQIQGWHIGIRELTLESEDIDMPRQLEQVLHHFAELPSTIEYVVIKSFARHYILKRTDTEVPTIRCVLH